MREIELMKEVGRHENIIQMYGCWTRLRPVCLVMEYAPGGDLLFYLRTLKRKVSVGAKKMNGITI